MKMRLNKFLAQCGVGSRRKCDSYIENGFVKINERVVTTLGTQVDPEVDRIYFKDEYINYKKSDLYIALYKPVGYVSTVTDNFGRKTVIDLLGMKDRIFPVGRLDLDSEGLLLLTNDGDFCYRLTHPKFEIDKVYRVHLNKPFLERDRIRMEQGLRLETGLTAPCAVQYVRGPSHGRICDVTIHEGKKRQVRNMFKHLGYKVTKLIRLRIGSIDLKNLNQGQWRYLTNNEINELKQLTQALNI